MTGATVTAAAVVVRDWLRLWILGPVVILAGIVVWAIAGPAPRPGGAAGSIPDDAPKAGTRLRPVPCAVGSHPPGLGHSQLSGPPQREGHLNHTG